jgi:CP family cyanate transporter-like MFS transporter
MYVVGLLGLLLAPGEAWLWAAICGVANGALFALNLTLPLDAGGGRAEVGLLTAKMLGAGYVIAAISPFALGAVRDGLGSFTGAMWVLVATSAVLCLAILALGRPRRRRRKASLTR